MTRAGRTDFTSGRRATGEDDGGGGGGGGGGGAGDGGEVGGGSAEARLTLDDFVRVAEHVGARREV